MKYIIDLPEEVAKASEEYWKKSTGMVLVPYTEIDRKAIEDEVWEFAKKVRLKEFFDDNHNLHPYLDYFDSYQDAKAKHDEWKKKEEICVGDEVIIKSDGIKGVILDKDLCGEFYVFTENGCCEEYRIIHFEKTGRHFDEVEELLRKMKVK